MISEEMVAALSMPGGPRRVTSSIPGPKAREIIERTSKYEAPTFLMAGSPVVYAGGKGSIIEDPDGNRFVDLWVGRTAATVGIGHPKVVDAIIEQTQKQTYAADGQTDVRSRVVEKINSILPANLKDNSKIILSFSGSQANEIAVRMAMKATGRSGVVTFSGSYHGVWGLAWEFSGSTRARQMRWGQRSTPTHFMPYPSTYRPAFGPTASGDDIHGDYLEYMLTRETSGVDDIACVIVETIQDDGYASPPPGWFKRLRAICDKIGAVLICDEVLSGLGFTGKMWALEHHGVEPDIVTIGKGLGGTLPMSAVAIHERFCAKAFEGVAAPNGGMGNPITCAAALATLDLITDPALELVKRAGEIGADTRKQVEDFARTSKIIGDIRIEGLMCIIELVRDQESKEPVASGRIAGSVLNRIILGSQENSLLSQGYLYRVSGVHKNCIKWMPSLTVPRALMRESTQALLDALGENEKALIQENVH